MALEANMQPALARGEDVILRLASSENSTSLHGGNERSPNTVEVIKSFFCMPSSPRTEFLWGFTQQARL